MISAGSRVRWSGLIGHEGTAVQIGANGRWAWVEYDDGTEKDAAIAELKEIEDENN